MCRRPFAFASHCRSVIRTNICTSYQFDSVIRYTVKAFTNFEMASFIVLLAETGRTKIYLVLLTWLLGSVFTSSWSKKYRVWWRHDNGWYSISSVMRVIRCWMVSLERGTFSAAFFAFYQSLNFSIIFALYCIRFSPKVWRFQLCRHQKPV
jgi:hypothetical protein